MTRTRKLFSAAFSLTAVVGAMSASACSSSEPAPSSGASGTGGNVTAGATSTAGDPAAGGGGAGAGVATTDTSGAGGMVGVGGTLSVGGGGATSGGVGGVGGTTGTGGNTGLVGKQDIMVLGSSNELITCWRAFLWRKLHAAQIENFDFVGGVTQGDDCGVAGYDKDLQAQSGQIVSTLPASKFDEWFTAHPPDIILMHFGGADLLQNMPVDGVLKAYTLMLTEARKVKPKVRLMAAQHTPQDSNGCDECDAKVLQLNADMIGWAATNTTADSPITIVDLFTDIVPATDQTDGVHLNPAGSEKVASRFFAVLEPLFKP